MAKYRIDVIHDGTVIRSSGIEADDDKAAVLLVLDKAPMLGTGIPLDELLIAIYRFEETLIGQIDGLSLALVPSRVDEDS